MLVYLAGPNNELAHVRQATLFANELLYDGHVCIGPYVQQMLQLISPRSPEEMLLIAQAYLEKSDVVFLMNGANEADFQESTKPVFTDYRKLIEFFREGSND